MYGHVRWISYLRDEFQISDAITDGYAELVGVDHPCERLTSVLAVRGFYEKTSSSPAPSSAAVITSTPRNLSPLVTARGTWWSV